MLNRMKKIDFAQQQGVSRAYVTQLCNVGRLGTIGRGRLQEINLDDPRTLECIQEIHENKAAKVKPVKAPAGKAVHFYAGDLLIHSITWPKVDAFSIQTLYPLGQSARLVEGDYRYGVIITGGAVHDVIERDENGRIYAWQRLNHKLPARPKLPATDPKPAKVKDEIEPGGFVFIKQDGRWVPIYGSQSHKGAFIQTFLPLPETIRIMSPEDGTPWAEMAGRRYDLYQG